MRIYPKGVTPECFYRGSTMLTTTLSEVEWVVGPVPNIPPGFPLKACGNDGLREGSEFYAPTGEFNPLRLSDLSFEKNR
jgi:hypothetical protein